MSMTVIEHIEVGSGGAASIEFTSIPDTYTDLYLQMSLRSTAPGDATGLFLRLNGSTVSYTSRRLYGYDTSSPTSDTNVSQFIVNSSGATSNTFASVSAYIPNYTSSANKSLSFDGVGEDNSSEVYIGIGAMLWSVTDAVTSIVLDPEYATADFAQYSSATLYGIRKYGTAGSPKATGGIISFDSANNKWVHTFTASGTFTPTQDITCEYLVVAGGGGGSQTRAGGGGAGGYRSSVSGESSGGGGSAESALSLTALTGYTVTVGAGGAGGTGGYASLGSQGASSVFSAISTTGGGRGGTDSATFKTGGSGGSGGGGTGSSGDSAGGSGTANEGFAGGTGTDSGDFRSGGGGGAGSTGTAGGSGGTGGSGVTSEITGSSIARAGGGGGGSLSGAGGTGQDGGGNGTADNTAGGAGTVNTGGGGGGGGYDSSPGGQGGNGGSGIVIVRYNA